MYPINIKVVDIFTFTIRYAKGERGYDQTLCCVIAWQWLLRKQDLWRMPIQLHLIKTTYPNLAACSTSDSLVSFLTHEAGIITPSIIPSIAFSSCDPSQADFLPSHERRNQE